MKVRTLELFDEAVDFLSSRLTTFFRSEMMQLYQNTKDVFDPDGLNRIGSIILALKS